MQNCQRTTIKTVKLDSFGYFSPTKQAVGGLHHPRFLLLFFKKGLTWDIVYDTIKETTKIHVIYSTL